MTATEEILWEVLTRNTRSVIALQVPFTWFLLARSTVPIIGTLRDKLMVRSSTFSSMIECAFCSGFWTSLLVWLPICHVVGLEQEAGWYSIALASFMLALPSAGFIAIAHWATDKVTDL